MKPYRFVDLEHCITFSQTSFQKNYANLNFHIFTTKIDGSEISLANERSLSRIPRVFPCKVHHCAKMNYHFIDACKALVIMITSFLNRGHTSGPMSHGVSRTRSLSLLLIQAVVWCSWNSCAVFVAALINNISIIKVCITFSYNLQGIICQTWVKTQGTDLKAWQIFHMHIAHDILILNHDRGSYPWNHDQHLLARSSLSPTQQKLIGIPELIRKWDNVTLGSSQGPRWLDLYMSQRV